MTGTRNWVLCGNDEVSREAIYWKRCGGLLSAPIDLMRERRVMLWREGGRLFDNG